MSLYDYDARKKHWISPRLALVYYEDLSRIFGENLIKGDFKKVFEGKAVALTLLGLHRSTGIHYMMQVPVEVNNSPDIVTMNLIEYVDRPVMMNLQDVEVVEYGENSEEDIATFLENRKLSPAAGKAYDEKTIILCHITKSEVRIDHTALHEAIKKLNPKPWVYLMGSIPGKNNFYRLVRVWPALDSPIEFDAVEEGIKYPHPDSRKFGLGTAKKIVYKKTNLPHPSPFEVFELDEGKLKDKFGVA